MVSGDVSGAPIESCPVCSQRGYNLVPGSAQACALCQGTGRLASGGKGVSAVCPDCRGIGFRW